MEKEKEMKTIFEGHVVSRFVKYKNEPDSERFTRIAFRDPEYKNDVQTITIAGDFSYGSKVEIAIEVGEGSSSTTDTPKTLTAKDLQ
jgi:hypothetical protein